MKLHIGPGTTYLPGWENVDIFSNVRADLYSSALALPYPRETFEIIYASHILEHFQRHTIMAALTHWRDLLMTGGVLRVAVPGFAAVCDRYKETGDIKEVLGLMYGGQRFILDSHHIIFDEKSLTEALKKAGFSEVRPWDWRKTEHSQYDDFSQAYLPHLLKDGGRLMSLNLEGIK